MTLRKAKRFYGEFKFNIDLDSELKLLATKSVYRKKDKKTYKFVMRWVRKTKC